MEMPAYSFRPWAAPAPSVALAGCCDEAHRIMHSEENPSNTGRGAPRQSGQEEHIRESWFWMGRARKHELYNLVEWAGFITPWLPVQTLGESANLSEHQRFLAQ